MTHSLEPSSSFGGAEPSPQATWRWRFEADDGSEVQAGGGASGASGFPSQSDAESWIGEVWQDLLEDGVAQVTLFDGDREVYGPMSLRPAG